MKRPVVFSLFRDQSIFMTVVMALMTFLAVIALGLALAIGTGAMRWNRQWDAFATIQITNPDNTTNVKKILGENREKIETVREIETAEMRDLMRPWIGRNDSVLEKYLPKMFEVQFKSDADMNSVGGAVSKYARFLTHRQSLHASISAGWKMVAILGVVLALIIAVIGTCISFIARNTAILHRRELEILNQVGASDKFIVNQMRIIIGKICLVACTAGYLVAVPILAIIIAVAHSARVGLMAMLGISGTGWIILTAMPVAIILFAIFITKKTTVKILNQEK